jgi:hypothetical protein
MDAAMHTPFPEWVDAVEKGQNEPIEIFACLPVEDGLP